MLGCSYRMSSSHTYTHIHMYLMMLRQQSVYTYAVYKYEFYICYLLKRCMQQPHNSTRRSLPPLPIPCLANFVICITFGESRGAGAGGLAGGTGERFILKQFKIFSCNYMSTSRKSRQDNDKDDGENGARSTATAARLFIGKHKHKYAYKYAYKHRCKWQTQIQWTDACAFGYVRVSPEIFAYCEL